MAWSAAVLAFLAGGTSAVAQNQTQPPASGSKATNTTAPTGGVNTVTNAPATPPSPAAQAAATGQPVQNPAHSDGTAKGVTPTKGFPAPPTPGATIKHTNPGQDGAPPNPDTKVHVDDNLVVDLHVNDEDLANVLQMLSIQSQRNIVASNNVSAKVKADLYGVTFFEALDAILHVNGYGYIDRGNFIYVYTLEELQQIEKATRVRVSKVMKLNYLNAVDAAEFVKPLLSEGGQIKSNGKTAAFPTLATNPVGSDDFANEATLVVYDFQEHVAEIEKLVKELDSRPAQVLVEATILQTQLNESNAWGVDFSLIADLNFTDFGAPGSGPLRSVDSMIINPSVPVAGLADQKGRAVSSTPGGTSGPATLKVGVIASDLALFVRMLDETGDTTILSNPKILALNRQPARVLVGRKVGYLSTTSTDTTTTQSVEFLDTGTQLYFRPFVTNEGLIRMELKPQVSEAVIRDAKDATGAAVTIPDEITNELVTNVMVRDGQTVVLGGLFREATRASRRQVPFLGDIPLLGAAFRGQEDETQRSEIIFMITPSVVNDNVLLAHGEEGKNFVERTRTGARQGLLPWSRDKMTGQKLIAAQKLAADGETNKALWKIRQALCLNPNQPEAITMRERLSNERQMWPNRSMLDYIMRSEGTGKPRSAFPANTPSTSATYTPEAPSAALSNAETETPAAETETPAAEPEVTPAEPNGDAEMVEPEAAPIDEMTPEEPEPAPEQETPRGGQVSVVDDTGAPVTTEQGATPEQVEAVVAEAAGNAESTPGAPNDGVEMASEEPALPFADALAGDVNPADEGAGSDSDSNVVTVGFVGQGILAPEYWEPPQPAEVRAARARLGAFSWMFGTAWKAVKKAPTTSQTDLTEVPEATDSNADK